jgi:hypothetical protein
VASSAIAAIDFFVGGKFIWHLPKVRPCHQLCDRRICLFEVTQPRCELGRAILDNQHESCFANVINRCTHPLELDGSHIGVDDNGEDLGDVSIWQSSASAADFAHRSEMVVC